MSKHNRNQSDISITSAIDLIASDNTSGAAEILSRAGGVFSILHTRHKERAARSVEEARQAIIDVCVGLVFAQPNMSALMNLASAAVSAAVTATSAEEALAAAAHAASEFIKDAAAKARAAAFQTLSRFRDGATVLTHSRSSTVLAAFVEARRAGKEFSVIATESRPMLEGRTLAESLVNEGISVNLIADAAASLVMRRVDLILVGADRVSPYYLVNKIGTHMIALAASDLHLPIYAVCDTSKFISDDYFGIRIDGGANELWPHAPPGVAVLNSYFEKILLQHFDGIISEEGIMSRPDVLDRACENVIHEVLKDALDRKVGQQ